MDNTFHKPLSKEEMSNLKNQILTGINSIRTSEEYKKFLDFSSSLYSYSSNNIMLMYQQKHDISLVGSFTFWKNNGRYVKHGEHGLRILAPLIKKVNTLVSNPEHLIFPEDKSIPELIERKVSKIVGYFPTYVFDISQTAGAPIPKLLSELTGNADISQKLIDTITNLYPGSIIYEDLQNEKGYFNGKDIVIKAAMSRDQTVKTLIHEYTHSILHKKISDYALNRGKYEIEAESCAYITAKHFGLDTSEYSFKYITSWANNKTPEQIQSCIDIALNTAKQIIDRIIEPWQQEYEQQQIVRKKEISSYIKKNGFIPTEEILSKYLSLERSSERVLTLLDIKTLISQTNSPYHKQAKELGEIFIKQECEKNKQRPTKCHFLSLGE